MQWRSSGNLPALPRLVDPIISEGKKQHNEMVSTSCRIPLQDHRRRLGRKNAPIFPRIHSNFQSYGPSRCAERNPTTNSSPLVNWFILSR